MNKTAIEWTHRPGTVGMTWNPIHFKRDDGGSTKTGNMCTRISPGCTRCYASRFNERWGNRLEYTVENLSKGHFYLDEKELQAPLRTKKPCTIFVGDMFDLFHEAIPDEMIEKVLAVCAVARQHVFQVLTKRAERLRVLLCDPTRPIRSYGYDGFHQGWPLKNLWLGVSVESQKYADERIPLLLETPAAVRFLSVEPQLEAVDLGVLWRPTRDGAPISWVICGGESGPGARPFNLAWAESLREQCKSAGVAFFMKQMGSRPFWTDHAIPWLKADRKGGDPSEWPESLRVREFPELAA